MTWTNEVEKKKMSEELADKLLKNTVSISTPAYTIASRVLAGLCVNPQPSDDELIERTMSLTKKLLEALANEQESL